MKRMNEIKLNFGDKIKCLEEIRIKDDVSVDLLILEKDENAEQILKYYNNYNQDKRYKYILSDYEVCNDGYGEISLEAI